MFCIHPGMKVTSLFQKLDLLCTFLVSNLLANLFVGMCFDCRRKICSYTQMCRWMLWNQFFLYSMFAISFIFCKWFKKKKGRERRECTQSACDGCLTLKAIWFHDAGHRSGAFYDHSQYIPQVCAERRQKQTQSSLLMGQHDDTFVPLLELNGCLRSNTKKIDGNYFKLNSY